MPPSLRCSLARPALIAPADPTMNLSGHHCLESQHRVSASFPNNVDCDPETCFLAGVQPLNLHCQGVIPKHPAPQMSSIVFGSRAGDAQIAARLVEPLVDVQTSSSASESVKQFQV